MGVGWADGFQTVLAWFGEDEGCCWLVGRFSSVSIDGREGNVVSRTRHRFPPPLPVAFYPRPVCSTRSVTFSFTTPTGVKLLEKQKDNLSDGELNPGRQRARNLPNPQFSPPRQAEPSCLVGASLDKLECYPYTIRDERWACVCACLCLGDCGNQNGG